MKREKGIQQNEKCFRSSPDTANAKDHSLPFSMKLFVVCYNVVSWLMFKTNNNNTKKKRKTFQAFFCCCLII